MGQRMKDKKILLMYASAGAGHKIACRAIEQAIKSNGFTGEIKSIDTLEHMPKFIANIFSKGYLWMATRVPWLWFALYEGGGKLSGFKPMPSWQSSMMKMILRKVNHLLIEEKPDYIVSAYFTSSWLAGRYKALFDSGCKAATVVTDYGLHPTWIQPNQDRYFVATEDNKIEMAHFDWYTKVDISKIDVAGIPVEERFTTAKDKMALRDKHKFSRDKFTVLILAGVYGPDHVEEIIERLCECRSMIQIIVVASAEFSLRHKVKAALDEKGISCAIYGRITFMEELMALSDVAITKTGGLTSSECMNCGCPLLIYLPYPGQEERNASYFLEKRAAYRIYQLESLAFKVDHLAENPDELTGMITAAKGIVRPDAAQRIAQLVLNDLSIS
jgi:processive 1,2-diacylglycerol beta-glucosyltransferase